MARLGKWGLLALTAAGLVVFAGKLVISKQPAPATAQPNPFMELFANALPHVEEALGCKLDALPQFCSA
ncbi:MAG TPA: hypothetical protein VE988_05680, partial [Gemmataceae bacterium]|nr:hypothetical protein [Gemmataceae bacterium]